jgi:hypothetical protein
VVFFTVGFLLFFESFQNQILCFLRKQIMTSLFGSIPTELFAISIVEPEYVCSICMNVFNHPVQCLNGHSFCKGCISKSLEKKSDCPICRVQIRGVSSMGFNLFLHNKIGSLSVKCPKTLKSNLLCSWVGKVDDLDKHIASCNAVNCKQCDAVTFEARPCALDCVWGKTCLWYGGTVCRASKVPVHTLICKKKEELTNCDFCGQHMLEPQIANHHLSCAANSTVVDSPPIGCIFLAQCPYAKYYGCGPECTGRLHPRDMKNHLLKVENMVNAMGAIGSKMLESLHYMVDYPDYPFTPLELFNIQIMQQAVQNLETIVAYLYGKKQSVYCGEGQQCKLYPSMLCLRLRTRYVLSGPFTTMGRMLHAMMHWIPLTAFGSPDATAIAPPPMTAEAVREKADMLEEMKRAVWTLSQVRPDYYLDRMVYYSGQSSKGLCAFPPVNVLSEGTPLARFSIEPALEVARYRKNQSIELLDIAKCHCADHEFPFLVAKHKAAREQAAAKQVALAKSTADRLARQEQERTEERALAKSKRLAYEEGIRDGSVKKKRKKPTSYQLPKYIPN